jgi:hypothetical protein
MQEYKRRSSRLVDEVEHLKVKQNEYENTLSVVNLSWKQVIKKLSGTDLSSRSMCS